MHLFPKRALALAALAAFGAFAAQPAAAQYAHLTLQSQPGDFVGGGVKSDITYTPANTNNYFFANANPYSRTLPNGPNLLQFIFLQNDKTPDNLAFLSFSTEQLGVPLTAGTYTDAQRAAFADAGHPGLDVDFQHRGSNTLTGTFTITNFNYTTVSPNKFVIDSFDATFEQHSEGLAPALFGQFSYRGSGSPAAVPEASTTVSLGLLLTLGLGSLIVAKRRKSAASS